MEKFLPDTTAAEISREIGRRLSKAMEGRLLQADLCRLLDDSSPNVSRYLNGGVVIPLDFLVKVSGVLGLNLHWVITGEGAERAGELDWSRVDYNELQDRAERSRRELEQNLLDFRAKVEPFLGRPVPLSEFAKAFPGIRRPEPTGPEIIDAEKLPPGEDWRGTWVPIVNRIAAGFSGLDTSEADNRAERFVRCEGAPIGAVAAVVEGNSMEPDYHAGDLVIADKDRPARSGVCVVIVKDDGHRKPMVKKLTVKGKVAVLESLNAKVKPEKVPAANIEAYEIWRHLQA